MIVSSSAFAVALPQGTDASTAGGSFHTFLRALSVATELDDVDESLILLVEATLAAEEALFWREWAAAVCRNWGFAGGP
jgi:hypothetical protein